MTETTTMQCKEFKHLDAVHGTDPHSPLHHDNRCPVNHGDTSELEFTGIASAPKLADAERGLLEQVKLDWHVEIEDLAEDLNEWAEVIHNPDALRAYARWAEARAKLAAFLEGDVEITELEPYADLFAPAMREIADRIEIEI